MPGIYRGGKQELLSFEVILGQTLSGLSVAMVLFLIAVGLSIIFGTLNVLNMAQGAVYMLGAYFCFWLTSTLVTIPGTFWLVLIISPLMVALIGGVVEVLLIRRTYGWDIMYQFILTFALILVITDVCKLAWGKEFHSVPTPWPLQGAISIWGTILPTYKLFIIFSGIAVFVALWSFFRYTRWGATIRAITYNAEMMSALGENTPRACSMVFMLGCWLSGLAGTLVAPMSTVIIGMDMTALISCFVIVVIGGLGSLTGAFIGAIALGFLQSFGILIMPELDMVFPFVLMAIVLIARPYGLMGRRIMGKVEL